MTLSVQPAVAQSDTKQQRETEEYLSQPLETADTTGGNLLSTDQTEGLNEQVDETDSSISWFIVKSILALGVVSIAIWGVSKLIQKSGFGSSDGDLMNIRSTLPVGQNQYLQIVQVGKQFFMLGVTKKNINMLGELDDSETIRSLQLQDETQQTDASSQQNGFSELLNRMIGTNDHDFSDQGSDSNQDPFDQIQQKMDQLRQSESTR